MREFQHSIVLEHTVRPDFTVAALVNLEPRLRLIRDDVRLEFRDLAVVGKLLATVNLLGAG
jgi:hypothetical protein